MKLEHKIKDDLYEEIVRPLNVKTFNFALNRLQELFAKNHYNEYTSIDQAWNEYYSELKNIIVMMPEYEKLGLLSKPKDLKEFENTLELATKEISKIRDKTVAPLN